MSQTKQQQWDRFQRYYTEFPAARLAVDISKMKFEDKLFSNMKPRFDRAFAAMAKLEAGAISNPDEKRRVGHYWLRDPQRAPTAADRKDIREALAAVRSFAAAVHRGRIHGAAGKFENLLLIGIGGSALGPQFVSHALGNPTTDKLTPYFFDNTDPDGMDRILEKLRSGLGRTLCIVISKSGGTKETRNGMLEAESAYRRAKLDFSKHAVAITSKGSALSKYAIEKGWIDQFPMWDWVGGRTSELSAVGLLPAALQGIDIDGMLAGAKACDEATRVPEIRRNPAALMAAMWYHAGKGRGDKNLVILPYKDRLELLSKYLQQLIMESLGKELNRRKKVVNQGITVLGNKGSTDQHAYVQQLREGRNDFFVTFVEVLRDRKGASMAVEPRVTSGDYLNGFLMGTKAALYDNGRESLTLTVEEVSPFTVGVLIALFERTVGLYASLVNINAYHQPGVEAGKKAASDIIQTQVRLLSFLAKNRGKSFTAAGLARRLGSKVDGEVVYKLCRHLAANPSRGVRMSGGKTPLDAKFKM